MKKRSLVLGLLVVSIFFASGSIASAAGTWRYGYNVNSAYSHYHHHRTHSATVRNNHTGAQGRDVRSGGVWARASVARTIFEKATFYYNYW